MQTIFQQNASTSKTTCFLKVLLPSYQNCFIKSVDLFLKHFNLSLEWLIFLTYVIISFLISFTLICNWPKQWIKLQYGHIQIKVQKLKTNSNLLKSSSLLPLIVDQLLVLIIIQLYYSFLIHSSEIVFVISWKPLKWVAVVVSNRFENR